MAFDRLEESQKRSAKTSDAYCEGSSGRRSREGEISPVDSYPLVLRQGTGCETSDLKEVNCRVVPPGQPYETLELYDGKLSRTVLRGESGRKPRDLPDQKKKYGG
jgi:hypothetical protein